MFPPVNTEMTSASFTTHDLSTEEVEKLVEVFTRSYEEQTGSSWSTEKLLSRARAWTFYGDLDGFVAVRKQQSGMKKLVAVAGSQRSILRGFNALMDEGGPIWGMVSEPIANMAAKKGMIAPHKVPGGSLVIRALGAAIPASVFGGIKPTFNKDGSATIAYDDVGAATKFLIANKEYFSHVLMTPFLMDQIDGVPGARMLIRLLAK